MRWSGVRPKICPKFTPGGACASPCAKRAGLAARMNSSLGASLVTNLLKNAYVHGDAGGEVTVTVSGDRLSVCNSGAGGALDADHIFERFYRGPKGGFDGTGPFDRRCRVAVFTVCGPNMRI